MKFRTAALATAATAAMLLPSAALAADVHITIGLKHVERDSGTKLKISGELHDSGGGAACTDHRHLKIQRRKNSSSSWNTIGHGHSNDNGSYKKVVGDKQGQYRVVAPSSSSCEKDSSSVANHSH